MARFILQRLLVGLLVVLGVVLVVFLLFMILPGDPARLTLGQRADAGTLEAINKEFGLDKPKSKQLLLYLNDLSPIGIHENTPEAKQKYGYITLYKASSKNAFQSGRQALVLKWPYLRRSYQSQQKVSDILLGALPNTVVLALSAFFIAALFGILFGIIAAVRHHTWADNLVMVIANLGISVPSFFAAIIIAWLFGYVWSKYTGLSMFGSLNEIDFYKGEYMAWRNLILPAVALGIRPLAIITQLTRSSMLDVLTQDYIRTATAKGLNRKIVIYKHALKNALNPVLTAVSGWLASLMAGAFFIEYIFGWRGLGKVTVDALLASDFPVVMGAVLLIAIIFVVVNIAVDILYGVFDPRVRIG